MRQTALFSLALWLCAGPASAETACSGLAWNLDGEHSRMSGLSEIIPSGSNLADRPQSVFTLALRRDAPLPVASQRPVDPAKFSGFVIVSIPSTGDYFISLSAEGWIDAVQNGQAVDSIAHTGDPDCPGLRKSVRFTLSASPLTLEISNAASDHIVVAVTPAH
jgi:hypothetical protein